jgi:TonB-linked SusC/RagA family outer membrane protein
MTIATDLVSHTLTYQRKGLSMKYQTSLWALLLSVLGVTVASAQTRIVTGRVTDSLTTDVITTGQVSVQGTTIGTTIKDDGTFTLAVPTREVVLLIRSIGFKRGQVTVPVGQNAVTIALPRDYFQLEAIVVTGQATGVERKNLANAVATVNAAQLASVPSAGIDQALQGKLAGANIIETSGAPGGAARVTLRGVTSINGAFTPLYVIDGVIASDIAIPRGTNFVSQASRGFVLAAAGENATNRISDLNPSDIENVEVLKGAAASAIYGSKASNGVIIVTTKRGRVGAPQFSITQRFGTAAVSKKVGNRVFPTLADAVAVYGATLAQDPVYGWAPGKVFDNEGELVGNKPLSFETAASMSGGTETTQYYASVLAKHEGGIMTNTFADKRGLRVNVDQAVGRRVKLSLGADVNNSTGDKGLTINENNNSSVYAALSNTPNFFDMRRQPDGTFNNPFVASNALQTAAGLKNRENVWRMLATGRMSVEVLNTPTNTLRVLANGGADFFNQENLVFSPPDLLFEPLDGYLGTSVASAGANLNYNLNANVVHTFKTGGGTSFTTQLGTQYETRELKVNRILAANLVGGLQVVTAGTVVGVDARHEYVKDFGFFAQEEFLTLGERLLLTVGLRADQSSNNGEPDKLFYYPKASLSFRFPRVAPGILDELKLRVAAGESGNQPLYGQKYSELRGGNVNGVASAIIQTSAAAANIVPEREREIEAGLDGALFGGRASLEITGYEKRITDLLLARGLPRSFGFSSEFLNGGVLRTRGLEVSLSGAPIQSRNLRWNPRLAFHQYRSVIVKLPVPTFGGGGFGGGSVRIQEGKSATQVYGTDSLPNGSTLLTYIGETRPDYQVQLGSDLTYKSVKFSFLLDRSKGGLVSNLTQWLYDLNGNSVDYDQIGPDGRKLGVSRPEIFEKHSRQYVQDASFLKLREASISVDLPASFVHGIWSGARYLRLGLSGRNLLTFTPYEGTDPEQRWVPEQGIASRLPQELWAYPPSRSFWLSFDLGF